MKKRLTTSCIGLFAALSLSACQELVETQPGADNAANPLAGFLNPLTQPLSQPTATTSTERSRLANGKKNFGRSATTTTPTTTARVVAQPTIGTTVVAPATTTAAATPVTGSQAINVQTADGRTIVLYPGQTYHGPDGRLYVYDPNALPIVTTGF